MDDSLMGSENPCVHRPQKYTVLISPKFPGTKPEPLRRFKTKALWFVIVFQKYRNDLDMRCW